MQVKQRCNENFEAIGFQVYSILDKNGIAEKKISKNKKFTENQLQQVDELSTYVYTRSVLKRLTLQPGDYVINR
jgi:hypothetical protein